jgi:glycerol uptake facilitator protein
MRPNLKGAVMELLGTFALCYIGGISISKPNNSLFGIAISHGLVLTFWVYVGTPVGSGHFNPAVTVSLIFIQKFHPIDGAIFILAQLLGAILAGVITSLLTDFGNCGCPSGMTDSQFSPFVGGSLEMISTFFYMLTVMAFYFDIRSAKAAHGFCIGGALTANMLAIGNITGAALNPFRHFGPKIGSLMLSGEWRGGDSWIYLMPFIGAAGGAILYEYLFLEGAAVVQDGEPNMQELETLHLKSG